VIVLVLFVGIVIWAWSANRKRAFDEAARLPLEDDDNPAMTSPEQGDKHG
jgi:cytochrome c oxidase cbb3-type subunit 4